MNIFVKSLYKFLCFRDTINISDSNNGKEMSKRLTEVFLCNEAFEFVEQYGKPGNMLYGEFMKEKIAKIRSKSNISIPGAGI